MLTWIASQVICWCTGPVNSPVFSPVIKGIETVRWALVLSMGFHAALVWFWWGGTTRPAALRTALPAPLENQQRMQIVMLPTQTAPLTPALPPSTPPTKQLSAQPLPAAPPRSVQKAKPTRQATSDLSTASALLTPSSLAAEPPPLATGQRPDPSSDPSPDISQPAQTGSGTRLNLDLGSALQAVERQRSRSPLAAAVDAQQTQTTRSVAARAFSVLDAPSSNIVSDAILSNGTRLVKFSGGGCMRLPNPAARSLGDIAKPVMELC